MSLYQRAAERSSMPKAAMITSSRIEMTDVPRPLFKFLYQNHLQTKLFLGFAQYFPMLK